VGEVDEDVKGLAASHGLKTAWHAGELEAGAARVFERSAKMVGGGDGPEPVQHVVPAAKVRGDDRLARWADDAKDRAIEIGSLDLRPVVRGGAEAVRYRRDRARRPDRRRMRIIGIHDREPPPLLGRSLVKHSEELRLGRSVGYQRSVKVEMLGIQVRENGAVEDTPVNAPGLEGVRADLDRRGAHPGGPHLGETMLEDRGWRRGQEGLVLPFATADVDRDGCYEASRDPCRPQDRCDQVGRRRLPVRSGYPDEPQVARGVAVECRRQLGQGSSGIRHQDHWHRRRRRGRLADDRGCSPCDGIRDEVPTVGGVPGAGDEDLPGAHDPAVVGDPGHLDRQIPVCGGDGDIL